MKLYYIMSARFPTEKAHGWQIAKMCEALQILGHDIVLVVPDRKTHITQSTKVFYGLSQDIRIIRLPVIDLFPIRWIPRRVAFFAMLWTYYRSINRWASKEPWSPAWVVTRDHFFAQRFQRPGWKVAFEAHDISQNFFSRHQRLGIRVNKLIMTNGWKRDEAIRRWGDSMREKTVVLPNAVDVAPYEHMLTQQDARQKLGWSLSKKVAVYTGHFYAWKGVFVLADAGAHLPSDVEVVLLGGTKEDFAKMRKYLTETRRTNIRLVPHVPHSEVLTYLAAADCLVIPNSAMSWNSMYTTSPIKLWEYLAARRPAVASDLPSLRELVSDAEVRFVRPDDPKELARAIAEECLGDAPRVEAGWTLVRGMSWTSRARSLIETVCR